MAESDDEIYRRHFEMESEKIRVERIKAKAAADAREANPSEEEVEREREAAALKQKKIEEREENIRLERRHGCGCLSFFALAFVFVAVGEYLLPEQWGILKEISGILGLIAFVCFLYHALAWNFTEKEKPNLTWEETLDLVTKARKEAEARKEATDLDKENG